MIGRLLLAAFAGLALSACGSWHYTVNAPLEGPVDPTHGYRYANVQAGDNTDSLMIVVNFSGGGMRAAALAYGVLERLAAERIRWNGRETRLLDEVDIITAVSGGAMTAAYYALHGDAIFTQFEERFFQRNLQDRLEDRIIAFSAIPRLLSDRYGRVDMLQELLDEVLFEGRTYADISAQRRKPFVLVTATDMSLGARFEFTQDTFDLLCSDLDKLPIARAVAASSALPVVLSPVTLWNYAGGCGFAMRSFPEAQGEMGERQLQRLRELESYLDRSRRPYVHLLDGGLSDNMGLRGVIEVAAMYGGLTNALRLGRVGGLGRLGHVRKLVFLSVNAETDSDRTVDASADTPTWSQVARALADIPINRYSFETQLIADQRLQTWYRALKQEPGDELDVYRINVSLAGFEEPKKRAFFMGVPTTLQLPRETVDSIRRAAAELLDASPDYRRLVDSLR
jgi:NTE family protein